MGKINWTEEYELNFDENDLSEYLKKRLKAGENCFFDIRDEIQGNHGEGFVSTDDYSVDVDTDIIELEEEEESLEEEKEEDKWVEIGE